jgi:ankyrin repeat protein
MNAVRTTARMTSLMFAANKGCLPTVQLLLSRGAEKKAKDSSNRTAANYASVPAVKSALK